MKKGMVLYTDIDEFCIWWIKRLVLQQELPYGECLTEDITNFDMGLLEWYNHCHFFAGIGGWALALSMAGVTHDFNVWTGSCPCQPFSTASTNPKGVEDDRHLWPEMERLIDFGKPTTFFGEQVASKYGWDWLSNVRADLENQDYEFGSAQLSAANCGLPHIRKRLYFVAHSMRLRQERMEPTWKTIRLGLTQEKPKINSNRIPPRSEFKPNPSFLLSHDGIPPHMAKSVIHGFGNAIVPELASLFIQSSFEAINSSP